MTVRVRNRREAYGAWDKRSVVIREVEGGEAIVYPSLPRGVQYHGFSLRNEYLIARLSDTQTAIRYCEHHYYRWSLISAPVRKD